MNKLIIANTGIGNQGKSSSIKEVYNLLVSRYPDNVQIIHPVESGDVKAIVDVKGVRIGIESQGDPNSRMFQSLQDFLKVLHPRGGNKIQRTQTPHLSTFC